MERRSGEKEWRVRSTSEGQEAGASLVARRAASFVQAARYHRSLRVAVRPHMQDVNERHTAAVLKGGGGGEGTANQPHS
jgi:hypothetical protein